MCTTCGCSVGQARVNGKSIAAHLTTGQSLKYRPLEQAHTTHQPLPTLIRHPALCISAQGWLLPMHQE